MAGGKTRWLYSVYGLDVDADCAIESLTVREAATGSRVRVWLDPRLPWTNEPLGSDEKPVYFSGNCDPKGTPTLRVSSFRGGSRFRLRYYDGTQFVVDRDGTRIWAGSPADATLDDTLTYLLGPVLGFVLRLRGVTCLHSSAVAVGDRAIAIVGPAGAGKSTTAAGFATRGFHILSDDIVALAVSGDDFLVQPGHPRICLWPDGAETVLGLGHALPRLTPADGINSWWDKRYFDLRSNGAAFQRESLPLGAVYIFDDRTNGSAAPIIEAVPFQAGLIALVANTYMNYLLDMPMRAEELEALSRLVVSVPIRRVRPQEDPRALPLLCKRIIEDFERLGSGQKSTRI